MSNVWDDMRRAIDDADSTLRAADSVATDMALLLVGRLVKVNSTDALKALKRELRDFNMQTGEWSE